MALHLITRDQVELEKFDESGVYLGDGVEAPLSQHMTAGWARYEPGAANAWTVDYDEVLAVIEGRFTITADGEAKTAGPGDFLFLTKGTQLVYSSEPGALVVYVSYPHWREAARAAGRL